MSECVEGGLGIVARQGQFGLEGAGVDLLRRLEQLQVDLPENALGALGIALFGGQVGGGQAQKLGIFTLAGTGFLEHLLHAGLGRAGQFAEVRGGRAAAGNEQAG